MGEIPPPCLVSPCGDQDQHNNSSEGKQRIQLSLLSHIIALFLFSGDKNGSKNRFYFILYHDCFFKKLLVGRSHFVAWSACCICHSLCILMNKETLQAERQGRYDPKTCVSDMSRYEITLALVCVTLYSSE